MGFPPEFRPKLLWPLNIQNVRSNGESFLVLKDERGIAEQAPLVPAALAPVLSRFDGERSLQEIAEEGAPYGLTLAVVTRLAEDLDTYSLLETQKTLSKWSDLQEAFRQSSVREAAFAGAVYSAEPEALQKEIEQYLQRTEARTLEKTPERDIVALISPHIDYRRGWQTYGFAYRALEQVQSPDVVFLLGTSHQYSESHFQLTDKSFETPLGTVPAARETIESVCALYGRERCFREEILHKREHSLELQLPFLAYRYAGEGIPEIVPILVGSFHENVLSDKEPFETAEIADFIGALAEVTKSLLVSGKRVLFFGGVDLAHVGTHFGDEQRVSNSSEDEIEARDRQLLDCVLRSDEQSLFEHIASDNDRRRICGFPSMYVMLAAMKRAGMQLSGHYLDYRQAVDAKEDCVVTFASAYWTNASGV